MSPVALESEADMLLLPVLSSPHGKEGEEPSSPQPVGRGREACTPKCFAAIAALPQQSFPIQNWCPDCSSVVHMPACWRALLLSANPSWTKSLFLLPIYTPFSVNPGGISHQHPSFFQLTYRNSLNYVKPLTNWLFVLTSSNKKRINSTF